MSSRLRLRPWTLRLVLLKTQLRCEDTFLLNKSEWVNSSATTTFIAKVIASSPSLPLPRYSHSSITPTLPQPSNQSSKPAHRRRLSPRHTIQHSVHPAITDATRPQNLAVQLDGQQHVRGGIGRRRAIHDAVDVVRDGKHELARAAVRLLVAAADVDGLECGGVVVVVVC
ncbi:hypothetical protein IWZ03DRAFT_233354 [Phyllosticta citriasiana]|uniref:Uncharacterized protein n=1 Tax=Phyllosticta citriasiana TaxID=595635 RepID=A0ABR1KJR1_9PEZI